MTTKFKIAIILNPILMTGFLSAHPYDSPSRSIPEKGKPEAINPYREDPSEKEGTYFIEQGDKAVEMRENSVFGTESLGFAKYYAGIRRSRFGQIYDPSQCGIYYLHLNSAFKDRPDLKEGLLSETLKQLESRGCHRIIANVPKLAQNENERAELEGMLKNEGFKPKELAKEIYVRDSFEPKDPWSSFKRRHFTHCRPTEKLD